MRNNDPGNQWTMGSAGLACPFNRDRQTQENVMVSLEQFTLSTHGHGHVHDLTDGGSAIVARSKVRAGIVHVFTVGSTAAVGTIEFEPGLREDLTAILDR